MASDFLSHFTPSLMSAEALEAIFVQRAELAARATELIRDSALTKAKHYTLLVGPRGIGKTHFVALVYHRIRAMNDLRDRLMIAWLREEEWGVGSFLDLLLRILRAIEAENPGTVPQDRFDALFELSPPAAEQTAAALLREVVAKRTLLILVENLDDLFRGLKESGQRRLRSFLQENPVSTILATSQALFNGVSSQDAPFYGFFRTEHLQSLHLEEAVNLLSNVAAYRKDEELGSFIRTSTGRARIRALYHLAGGNHRVFIIFAEFLTKESLDELITPFIKTLDELTPYYQSRLAYLSTQQRKIVEFFCDRRGAAPVKEIAQRCFISQQTASSQLGDLLAKGYVVQTQVGRESYYELKEPLMRLTVEVKKNRGEPVRLLVDFLRFWYTRPELERRLGMLAPTALIEREYVSYAIDLCDRENDPRVEACLRDFEQSFKSEKFLDAAGAAEDLIAVRGSAADWAGRVRALFAGGKHDEALEAAQSATTAHPKSARLAAMLAITLLAVGRTPEAHAQSLSAIALDSDNPQAWEWRGRIEAQMGNAQSAVDSFAKAISLDAKNWKARRERARALMDLARYEAALQDLDVIVDKLPDGAEAFFLRGRTLWELDRTDAALADMERAAELDVSDPAIWSFMSLMQGMLKQHEASIATAERAIRLNEANAMAWFSKGANTFLLGRFRDSIAPLTRAADLAPTVGESWYLLAHAQIVVGLHEQSLYSINRAIEVGLDQTTSDAWCVRAQAHLRLGQWEEVLQDLQKAISTGGKEPQSQTDVTAFLRLLLSTDSTVFADRVVDIVRVFDDGKASSILAADLIAALGKMLTTTDEIVENWLNAWTAAARNLPEFGVALRLLDAAVRYRRERDPRILLELPIEERQVLDKLFSETKDAKAEADPAPDAPGESDQTGAQAARPGKKRSARSKRKQ